MILSVKFSHSQMNTLTQKPKSQGFLSCNILRDIFYNGVCQRVLIRKRAIEHLEKNVLLSHTLNRKWD